MLRKLGIVGIVISIICIGFMLNSFVKKCLSWVKTKVQDQGQQVTQEMSPFSAVMSVLVSGEAPWESGWWLRVYTN